MSGHVIALPLPNKAEHCTLHGEYQRVRVQYYSGDRATVVVKHGGRSGLSGLARAACRRMPMILSHAEAKAVARWLAPIIDGYAAGTGIRKPAE